MLLPKRIPNHSNLPTIQPNPPSPPPPPISAAQIAKLISDHPFPHPPLDPLLRHHLRPPLFSSPLIESILTHLHSSHSHPLKALTVFHFSSQTLPPTLPAFNTTLCILTRAKHFDKAWTFIERFAPNHPSLITPKSLSVLLSRYAKFRSFNDTVEAFERMERLCVSLGRPRFGADEFNVLLRAFCAPGRVAEARAVFRRFFSRYPHDARTFNVLLLGFKESGDVSAVDSFYYESVARGFEPNAVTFNIRIDAYCKGGQFSGALGLLKQMEVKGMRPTLETLTTLVHGACIAKNPIQARHLFDEISVRGFRPDVAAYNALLGAFTRTGDVESALNLMGAMENEGIEPDDVTYHTMFRGLSRGVGFSGVLELYRRMVEKGFVPETRTVVVLVKLFCENGRSDVGVELWGYLIQKGYCPHGHALVLLATGLCCAGRVGEAYECFRQVVERGRRPSESGLRVLEGFLAKSGEHEKLRELYQMMSTLQANLDSYNSS